MSLSKAIGGYFGLEIQQWESYHKNVTALNTGRNAFEYILKARKYTHIYIPYYTCEVLLEPIRKLNISYNFYSINEKLEPILLTGIKSNSAYLYTNYFGLKTGFIKQLAAIVPNLIIDASQAFFEKPLAGIDTFYSPRKFFGVPDGGYASCDIKLLADFEEDNSVNRFSHLITRIDKSAEEGYADFKRSELSLGDQPIKKMSKLTTALLNSIDYQKCLDKRNENFHYLHSFLKEKNVLQWITEDMVNGPLVYPFYAKDIGLRKRLFDNNIYTAQYWPEVLELVSSISSEFKFVNNIINIPIDQRWSKDDLKKIVNIISNEY